MKLVDLLHRKGVESQWRKDFMVIAIRAGLSVNAADRLSESKRATELMEQGYSAAYAYNNFEAQS